jgi:hypothetical protein
MITRDYFGYADHSFDIVTDKLKKMYQGVAAGELSRAGLHKEAKELILELKYK